MRYYAEQPNGLYCAYSTVSDELSVLNLPAEQLKFEMLTWQGDIVSFDKILEMLKDCYPYSDLTELRLDLKRIGYEDADNFVTDFYLESLNDENSKADEDDNADDKCPDCTNNEKQIAECQDKNEQNKQPVTDKQNKQFDQKMEYTFDAIRENGLLLYEYIRGSQAYGLALPTSDEDRSAVYCAKIEDLMGLSEHYVDQVNDERNDVTWYELKKYVELLCKANPTMLESLFVPERCIVYMHPAFKIIYDNRDIFITKKIFDGFFYYAKTQIEKARGLNKKIVNPITKRLSVLDFCHVPKGQGSQKIEAWLKAHGLKQNYCGLNNLDHMNMCSGVCYDYGTHLRCEYTAETFNTLYNGHDNDFNLFMQTIMNNNVLTEMQLAEISIADDKYAKILEYVQPKGYHGIMKADGTSNEIRLDSLQKYDQPLCYLQYNKDGYAKHCRDYKDYQDWVKKRNPVRYKENEGKEFDRKNMCHSFRLLTMGIEIARTGKVNVDRTDIDRNFLLNIRLGNATYEDLMEELTKKFEEFQSLIPTCTLPETVDRDKVNQIMVNIRKEMAK